MVKVAIIIVIPLIVIIAGIEIYNFCQKETFLNNLKKAYTDIADKERREANYPKYQECLRMNEEANRLAQLNNVINPKFLEDKPPDCEYLLK